MNSIRYIVKSKSLNIWNNSWGQDRNAGNNTSHGLAKDGIRCLLNRFCIILGDLYNQHSVFYRSLLQREGGMQLTCLRHKKLFVKLHWQNLTCCLYRFSKRFKRSSTLHLHFLVWNVYFLIFVMLWLLRVWQIFLIHTLAVSILALHSVSLLCGHNKPYGLKSVVWQIKLKKSYVFCQCNIIRLLNSPGVR